MIRTLISFTLVLSIAACGSGSTTTDASSGGDAGAKLGDMAGNGNAVDLAGDLRTAPADMLPFNDKAFASGGMGCGYQEDIGCPKGTYSYNCVLNAGADAPAAGCTKLMGAVTIYCCTDPVCTRFPRGDGLSCGPANMNRPPYSWTCPGAAQPGGDCTPDGTGVYCCSRM